MRPISSRPRQAKHDDQRLCVACELPSIRTSSDLGSLLGRVRHGSPAQIVPPQQPPMTILKMSSGLRRVDFASWVVDYSPVFEVLMQGEVVRIQEACPAHLRQCENVSVIRLACAFIAQLFSPCCDTICVQNPDPAGKRSLHSPAPKSLIPVEFIKQLSAGNEPHPPAIDPRKESFARRRTRQSKYFVGHIHVENRTHQLQPQGSSGFLHEELAIAVGRSQDIAFAIDS